MVLIIAIFMIVTWFAWWWTEGREKYRPEWLNYQPFNCIVCLTFWLLVFLYITAALIFSSWTIAITGIILASLNAIAMKVHQKHNTVSINDEEQ